MLKADLQDRRAAGVLGEHAAALAGFSAERRY